MTKLEALKILSEITPEEVDSINRKLEQAQKKIQFRRNNTGKAFPVPVKKWHSRNTRCPTCGGIHVGFRCPTAEA